MRASFEYGTTVEVLVVFYGVAVLDDTFGSTKGWRGAEVLLDMSPVSDVHDVLIRRQRIRMYLDAHGARRVLVWADFVQPQDLARRVVELVVVNLYVGEGGVELHVDIADPGRELEGGHGV